MAKKKRIARVLFILFLVIDCLGVVVAVLSMPSIAIPRRIHHVVNYWVGSGPKVSVDLEIVFSAWGSVSVNNPVHIHVTLTNANVSDLHQYYNEIGFTEAYSETLFPNQRHAREPVGIPITPLGSDMYEADGTVVWLHEGPTWPVLLVISPNPLMVFAGDVQVGDPAIVVASVSDTLSVRNAFIETVLTFVLVGFSVLMLQPILEVLFPDTSRPEAEAKPQQPPQQSPQETKEQKVL